MRGVLAISFALTLLLTPVIIVLLRRFQLFDIPTERSSHVQRTPRGGGAAVALGAVSGVVLAGTAGVVESWSLKTLLVCTSFFAVVGFIDDLRTLDVKPRLLCQLGCAVVFVGPWFFANVPLTDAGIRIALAIVAVIWVMGFLNAFNFMDGVNGISGLHAALAGGVFVLLGHLQGVRIIEVCGMAVAAASLGFLPYNFPKARVFLGDVGSYFLGTWLAVTALIALVWSTPVEAVLGPFVIYLADTSWTLVDRVRRGEDWRRSHHDHVYQRLIELRWSHTRTALTVLGFSVACACLGLVSMTSAVGGRIIADVAVLPVVVAYLLLPRLIIERRTKRSPRIDRSPATPAHDLLGDAVADAARVRQQLPQPPR